MAPIFASPCMPRPTSRRMKMKNLQQTPMRLQALNYLIPSSPLSWCSARVHSGADGKPRPASSPAAALRAREFKMQEASKLKRCAPLSFQSHACHERTLKMRRLAQLKREVLEDSILISNPCRTHQTLSLSKPCRRVSCMCLSSAVSSCMALHVERSKIKRRVGVPSRTRLPASLRPKNSPKTLSRFKFPLKPQTLNL